MMPYVRPARSARGPARNDARAAGISIDDTIRPCTSAPKLPFCLTNCSMVVTGPMTCNDG